jgi:hypothetical protein
MIASGGFLASGRETPVPLMWSVMRAVVIWEAREPAQHITKGTRRFGHPSADGFPL